DCIKDRRCLCRVACKMTAIPGKMAWYARVLPFLPQISRSWKSNLLRKNLLQWKQKKRQPDKPHARYCWFFLLTYRDEEKIYTPPAQCFSHIADSSNMARKCTLMHEDISYSSLWNGLFC